MITDEFYNLSKPTMQVFLAIMEGQRSGFPGGSIGKLLSLKLIHRDKVGLFVPYQVELQYKYWLQEQAKKAKEKVV